ncbi:hypothetical protein IMG5_079820 [Ichthyophthirius multifiliis]|uniref:poly(A)-specific ribonuclease n=1 Tax=Ichthyophthirius multifiliis TaxID=5932 RepID=G0R6P2_ICHMU|nr:hypothetical protein IMG5_079820 [Ichthyophthirius multifiliis]EGR26864.1 hypothetical protein IMG5_079820 [Ichthyophthirius multifiliis]|eukprot:XP_004023748.1 hypothetical protein IMG5_079820 [Ichthyophthirius multifiliis]
MIQLGLTFAKSDGTFPQKCTFQFNFAFNKNKDNNTKEAIKFLEESGIKFDMHQKQGIQLADFAEMFFGCGLLCNEDITWITFHGGFDFAYFLKLLIDSKLPNTCKEFYEQFYLYFPQTIDVKLVIQEIEGYKYKYLGLERLSKNLQIDRIGPQHQAGSDSLLTMKVFLKLKEKNSISQCYNQIFGLNELEDEKSYMNQQQQYITDYPPNMFGQNIMDNYYYQQQSVIGDQYYFQEYQQLAQNQIPAQYANYIPNRNYSGNTYNNGNNEQNKQNSNAGQQPKKNPSQR